MLPPIPRLQICFALAALLVGVVLCFIVRLDIFHYFFDMNGTTISRLYNLISSLGLLHSYSPIVDVNGLGRVRGIISQSREGKTFYEFRAIPYGKAPVDELRFEPPVAYGSWDDVLIAHQWGPACLQFDAIMRGELWGKEDCLKLNVFTTNLNPKSLMPVIAYVHGGGFVGGESSMYSPKYFMDHPRLVFVTFNYRLGSLGFLNTGDEHIRGNMGLKDQNLALRWIRDHISNFGGDPEKVTIMGESAGGASAHYHVISPLSRGLFRRAILQSGSLGSPWSFTRNPRNQAMKFGAKVGCPVENTTVLVECLKRMDPRDIVKHHEIILSPIHTQDDFFCGSVEAVSTQDSFLVKNPYAILERGDFARIPIMLGVSDGDGGLKTARLEAYPDILRLLGKKWNTYVPILMHYNPARTNVSDALRKHYFQRKSGKGQFDPAKDLVAMTKMLGVGIFHEGIHKVGRYHAKYTPTYLYYYTYVPHSIPTSYIPIKAVTVGRRGVPWVLNLMKGVLEYYADKLMGKGQEDPTRFGACHGDESLQLFSIPPLELRTASRDYKDISFHGLPWPPVNPKDPKMKYMELNGEGGRMIYEPFAKDVQFLESLNIRDPNESENW